MILENMNLENIDLSKLTIGFVLGYAISWAYFFLSLPIIIKLLGKVNGTIINYGLSWIVWILSTYLLHFSNIHNYLSTKTSN